MGKERSPSFSLRKMYCWSLVSLIRMRWKVRSQVS